MFNLMKIIDGMTPTSWIIAAICVFSWIIIIHCAGKVTEKRWGDRESGALVGFFLPGFVFMAMLYFM
ncbi:hypothetical protein [Endozoicomonas sp. SCSIO W0465]|uniref:hypothetical protein n=1 Tax=Endozoicomonas sp. SCSIO W0465 TaxID=2918516 RepID=UPI002074EA48|nr:hypothetical protein [Endozoicomonas sp. SCSIO W0465]USE34730.1 hypothetical protein MJO57_21735 [Endozoicomonas sp. SCSIO W0465]